MTGQGCFITQAMKYNCAILVNNQYCVDKCLLRMSIALMNSQRLELLSAVITHVPIVYVCVLTEC